MSVDLSTILQVPYVGTPFTRASAQCTPSKFAPCMIPLTIDWVVYWQALGGNQANIGINVDASSVANTARFDVIKSIKIDNSFSTVPIQVTFPDTGDIVTAPPQTVVTFPCNTNGLQCTICAEGLTNGFIPKTMVYLFNYPQAASVDPVIQYTFPQWKGSPSIQQGSDTILTPGYAPPALGDQTVEAICQVTSGATATIFNQAIGGGFWYVTGMYFTGDQLSSSSPVTNQVFIESTGGSGLLFVFSVSTTASVQSQIILPMTGMQLRLTATELWRIRNVNGLVSGLLKLIWIFTYNPT